MEEDFPFDIIEHSIPVFFREYMGAVIDDRKDLHIAIKQYVPKHVTSSENAVTIMAAGGLGFIKELYEPLFIELHKRGQQSGLAIRSIWIADMFNTGQSAVMNRENLGCDPAWIDHTRDLMCAIYHFRSEMIRPIMGLGHSMGCNQLAFLSHWHPNLFSSFAFIEAGIDIHYGKGLTIPWMLQTLKRKPSFATRNKAEEDLVKAHAAANWDERTITRLKKYGVYELDNHGISEWRSTTPKDQIAGLVSRFNSERVGLGPGGINDVTLEQRKDFPDIDPDAWNAGAFYRPELRGSWDLLRHIRPRVLYVNGGKSPVFGRSSTRDERAKLTGTGVGGNGGLRLGAVKQIIVKDGEHTMVFDQHVNEVAQHVADWVAEESQRCFGDAEKTAEMNMTKDLAEKQTVSPKFMNALIAEMTAMGKSRKKKAKL